MNSFENFVQLAEAKEFNQHEMLIFFQSMYNFIEFITPGIPILAGNITTELVDDDYVYESHRVGRLILRASTDEFGLNGTKPHNELLLDFAQHWGFTKDDVRCIDVAVPASLELGKFMRLQYRNNDYMHSFGVHVASEETGYNEAHGFARIFKPPKYGLTESSPAYQYIQTHVQHEDQHSDDTTEARKLLESIYPQLSYRIHTGYQRYMNLYQNFISELSDEICG